MKNNKLKILINTRMKELGLKKSKVVTKMGYNNLNKGIRKLDRLTQNIKTHDNYISDLAKVLEIEKKEITNLIDEYSTALRLEKEQLFEDTRVEREIEKKLRRARNLERFLPHICSIMEHENPVIDFVGDLTFSERYIYFEKKIIELQLMKQLKIVERYIIQHQEKFKDGIPYFGKITHYVYRWDYDEKKDDIILFNTKGIQIVNPEPSLRRFSDELPYLNYYITEKV